MRCRGGFRLAAAVPAAWEAVGPVVKDSCRRQGACAAVVVGLGLEKHSLSGQGGLPSCTPWGRMLAHFCPSRAWLVSFEHAPA